MIITKDRDTVSFRTSSGVSQHDLRFSLQASVNSLDSNSVDITILTSAGRENLVFGLPYEQISFNNTSSVASSASATVTALNSKFLYDEAPVYADSPYNISDFVKPDLTAGKSETTDFVHNDSIANGGAVILQTEEAKIGVQGNHIEFDSTGSYGDVNINVKTSASQSDNAIHVFGTNLFQNPQIEMKGDTEFEGSVTLTASNGNKYYLKVSNTGNLYTEAV